MKKWVQEHTALLVISVVFLVAFSLISDVVASKKLRDARADFQAIESEFGIATENLTKLNQQLAKTKKIHDEKYWVNLNFDYENRLLKDASERIQRAKESDTVSRLRTVGAGIKTIIQEINPRLAEKKAYLDKLDLALKNYKTAPEEAQKLVQSADNKVKEVETQGFFSNHFDQSRRLISEAAEKIELAKHLRQTNEKEYLMIWDLSQRASRMAKDAFRLAETIVALRKTNDDRIAAIPVTIKEIQDWQLKAKSNIEFLAAFPSYSQQAENQFSQSQKLVSLAEILKTKSASLNDMTVQKFAEAAKILGQAEENLSQARQSLDQIADLVDKTKAALKAIPDSRKSAQRAIDEAQNQIDDYSNNDQSEAIATLSEARRLFQKARGLAKSDPIKSNTLYRQAETKAKQAYDEVDTHRESHTGTSSSSSDWNSSSSPSGGDSFGSGSSTFGGGDSGMSGGGFSGGSSGMSGGGYSGGGSSMSGGGY